MYTAITSDNVDVITAFSTDGLLQKYDLVLLEDDKISSRHIICCLSSTAKPMPNIPR